jgi:hypothetical protein
MVSFDERKCLIVIRHRCARQGRQQREDLGALRKISACKFSNDELMGPNLRLLQ